MPLVVSGLFRLAPPRDFVACAAGTLGDARDGSISDSKKIITKSHVNWGHVPANRLKRVLVEAEGGNSHMVNFADEVLDHCDA